MFDFRNKKKVCELESKLSAKEKECQTLEAKIIEYQKKLSGDRVCCGYCENCVHAIKKEYVVGGCVYPYSYPEYICELDCRCKDYQRK
jgi:hypothetical protein